MESNCKEELLLQSILPKEIDKFNVIESYNGTKTLKEIFAALILSELKNEK